MSLIKNFEAIKKDIFQILTAIANNIDDFTIFDSYENINKNLLNHIKSHDFTYWQLWFDMIEADIEKKISIDILRDLLYACPNPHKKFIDYILESIYNDDIIEVNDDFDYDDIINDIDVNDATPQKEERIAEPITEVITSFKWRANQELAVKKQLEQLEQFENGAYIYYGGVHNQIMGAGKTFTIYHIIQLHYLKNKNNKLYIITCKQQEILKDLLFDEFGEISNAKKKFLANHGIIDLDLFNIINRVHNKNHVIELADDKPNILIVNTKFLEILVKQSRFNCDDINFVILDECHGISAPGIYNVLKNIKYNHKKAIIGFSATPIRVKAEQKLVNIFSKCDLINDNNKKLNSVSNYDLITAIKDGVILSPYFILCEIHKTLNNKIGKDNKFIMKQMLQNALAIAPYQKVIAWCRTISQMKEYYKFISEHFPDYKLYCFSSVDTDLHKKGYNTNYNDYCAEPSKAILICVNRCREGSDIFNLDIAIYLDLVKKRSLLVGLQTFGRVLRKDKLNRKKHGIIIDSFVNVDCIQIETITAEKIINYYKDYFALCDDNEFGQQMEQYNKMLSICQNITYDEITQEISINLDDDNSHAIKVKLELKTKSYDFNKMKVQMDAIINKMFNISDDDKFNDIITKIKPYFTINDSNFWLSYDNIPNKIQLNIPSTSDEFFNSYKDKFTTRTWYQILNFNTDHWYPTISICRDALSKLTKKAISNEIYFDCIASDPHIPPNPSELYKLEGFISISSAFNLKKTLKVINI